MTEDQWNSCNDVTAMLEFLRTSGNATERKLRLFAVATCRRIWQLLTDERSRRAVEVAEVFADDPGRAEELTAAYYAANVAWLATDPLDECYHAAAGFASSVAYALPLHGCYCTSAAAAAAADAVADTALNAVAYKTARAEELAIQCRLLRDLFGNPFRPVTVEPPWRTPAVLTLAQDIYHQRSFDLLPELAALLEAAGCQDAGLLGHLRVPGPHARGCFALDAVLGKKEPYVAT